jgi:eukaryotic-like serine/threonine-protein kinase
LKALLPESGTDIRGHMRSHAELLEASGYASRPKEFDALLHMLDSELRLITPTDPEGADTEGQQPPTTGAGKYYQLTHDYLVPSLRDWLTRKQKETRRGRAELLLADRAGIWKVRQENRQLPSLPQWLSIQLLTQRKNWTEPRRKMMRKATRYHAVRGVALALLLMAITLIGVVIRSQVVEQNSATRAAALVQRLLYGNIAQVPGIITEIEAYRAWADPLLREENEKAAKDSRQKLHTSLALLPVEPGQMEYLYNRLLKAEPYEVPDLRDALLPHKQELLDKLWTVVEAPARGQERQRLRAACALAGYDPQSQRWAKVQDPIVNDLVGVAAVHFATWMGSLRPVRGKLQAPLVVVFRDASRPETERSVATYILADYAADQPQILADLLLDADAEQFAVLYPKLKDQGDDGRTLLLAEMDKPLLPDAKEDAKEKLAKRQANAAVALLKMDKPEWVWPLLKHSSDPRMRSYLIHRLGPFGAEARAIVKRLEKEPDVTIRRALVLSLGEFGEKEFPLGERALVVENLRQLYRNDPDPGLHAAAEWLLRHWKQSQWLKQTDEKWAKDKKQQEQRLERIRQELAKEKGAAKPQWYVNGQGHTMVVIPGPVEFWMGSPPTEQATVISTVGKIAQYELLHRQRIGRTFAIATKPVTMEQFVQSRKGHDYNSHYAPTVVDCPQNNATWYVATRYCNWLSEQEGIAKDQWCYEPNSEGEYSQGMKLKANYLRLSGYRLLTEAEWEYACRAGAVTSRYYGESVELLRKYAWYVSNSGGCTWPVGSLKPNDLGLFDMHGNVWCCCQERHKNYAQDPGGKPIEDNEDILSEVNDKEGRVGRGGSFDTQPEYVRSANRDSDTPSYRGWNVGFRPARTITAE